MKNDLDDREDLGHFYKQAFILINSVCTTTQCESTVLKKHEGSPYSWTFISFLDLSSLPQTLVSVLQPAKASINT